MLNSFVSSLRKTAKARLTRNLIFRIFLTVFAMSAARVSNVSKLICLLSQPYANHMQSWLSSVATACQPRMSGG